MNSSSQVQSLQKINEKLRDINEEYQKKFNNNQYKSPLLNRKEFSIVMQQIYAHMEAGSIDTKIIYMNNKSSYILSHLEKLVYNNYSNDDFTEILAEKWKNFKHFVFYYNSILQAGHIYYESQWFYYRSSPYNTNFIQLESQQSIYPIPVIALHYFKVLIINKYHQKLVHTILDLIHDYRNLQKQRSDQLKSLIQMMWSCSMGQLTRIRVERRQIEFYKQQRADYQQILKRSVEQTFKQQIFGYILQETQKYYFWQSTNRICHLSQFEQIIQIGSILDKETQFRQLYFFTKYQKSDYLGRIIQKILTNQNFQTNLRAMGSLKQFIQNYRYNKQDYEHELRTYLNVLKPTIRHEKTIKVLGKIFLEIILEKGKEINQKVNSNKRKEYIQDMFSLKTSIIKIIHNFIDNNLVLKQACNKTFKKILDSIECARNLAEYTDYCVKECARQKLDEQGSLAVLEVVFSLLTSIASTDSFVLYHQEYLSKRLIDVLNEPKLDNEYFILKKISEQLGFIAVDNHRKMLKDVEHSTEITESFNKKFPFSSYKWSLKLINPLFWPDFVVKQKLKFLTLPKDLLHQIDAIQGLYRSQNQYRSLNWKLQKGISLFEGSFRDKKIKFQTQNSYMMLLFFIAEQHEHQILFGNLKTKVKAQKPSQQQQGRKYDPLSFLIFVLIQNGLVLRKNTQVTAEIKYPPLRQEQYLAINLNFTPPSSLNLKPGQPMLIRPSAELAKESQKSSIQNNKILKDRQKVIEAVLVKSLKHSHSTKDNSITFAQLYENIKLHQYLGAFNIPQTIVKQRLEELIIREFCTRDEQDRRIYHYVA